MLHVNIMKEHLNDAVVNTYQFNNVDEAKTTKFVGKKTENVWGC